MIPLVIASPTPENSDHLLPDDGRPVMVLQGDWEIQHLKIAAETFETFLFLKPSVRILDPERFWATVDHSGPSWLFAYPSCYLAIYDSETLREATAGIAVFDKGGSIEWESRLQSRLRYPVLWPEICDQNAVGVEYIDGLPELIIGNDIVQKLKGTVWCRGGCCEHVCKQLLARFQ